MNGVIWAIRLTPTGWPLCVTSHPVQAFVGSAVDTIDWSCPSWRSETSTSSWPGPGASSEGPSHRRASNQWRQWRGLHRDSRRRTASGCRAFPWALPVPHKLHCRSRSCWAADAVSPDRWRSERNQSPTASLPGSHPAERSRTWGLGEQCCLRDKTTVDQDNQPVNNIYLSRNQIG